MGQGARGRYASALAGALTVALLTAACGAESAAYVGQPSVPVADAPRGVTAPAVADPGLPQPVFTGSTATSAPAELLTIHRRASSATSAPPAAPAPPSGTLRIVPALIPYPGTRQQEMAAYSLRHYGTASWQLTPTMIVLHYTAGGTWASTRAVFAADTVNIGELPGTCAHYVVDKDGTVYQLVPTSVRCRHAIGLNDQAIGIEMVQEGGTSRHVGRPADPRPARPGRRGARAGPQPPGPVRDPDDLRHRARDGQRGAPVPRPDGLAQRPRRLAARRRRAVPRAALGASGKGPCRDRRRRYARPGATAAVSGSERAMGMWGVERGVRRLRRRSGRRGWLARSVILVLLALVAGNGGLPTVHAAPATPTYVQGRANEAARATTTNAVAFSSANTAGNLLVVYAIWDNSSAATISDTRGNSYASVAPPSRWKGSAWSSQVFYAKNVAGGANTVTLSLTAAVTSWSVVYVHEYSGLDKVSPIDVSVVGTGTSSAMSSGSATTTNPTDLVFGAGASDRTINAGGTGFTSRLTNYGNRTQDKRVTATGANSATGTQNGAAWVMHMVAFKADPGTPADTTPPSAPTALTATPASTTQINLAWNPSSDNVSVAGYRVFRNGTQVGTPGTTLFQDTGLTPSTSYSYTVAAVDGAGNVSAQSTPVSATTKSPPTDATPPSVILTAPAAGATLGGHVDV